MSRIHAIKFLAVVSCLPILAACQSTAPQSSSHNKVAVSKDVEVVWAAGMRGLRHNLGLAGSCPTPEFYAHEIPNEPGVGFGICFIPRFQGGDAMVGVSYAVTPPGEGAIDPETKKRIKRISALTQCFNGRPCFGGYIPSENEFVPGEWLFEFYRIDRKIMEFKFVVKAPTKERIAPNTSINADGEAAGYLGR